MIYYNIIFFLIKLAIKIIIFYVFIDQFFLKLEFFLNLLYFFYNLHVKIANIIFLFLKTI